MRFYPLLATAALSGLVLSVSGAAEPDLNVGAHVDKTEVGTGDVLSFAVTISGPLRESPRIELSTFEGFQVVSTGQSQQLQVRAGQMRQTLTLTYTLAPTIPGTHTLGPVKVEYKGRVYETQPIEVKVVEGKPKEEMPPEQEQQEEQQEEQPKMPRLEGGVIL